MHKRIILLLLIIGCGLSTTLAQHVIVAGRITDDDTHKPIAFATILMKENGYWAITGDDGSFSMKNIPVGKATLTIQCLGYATRQLTLDIIKDIPRLRITLKQETLKLDEVTVTAQRKNNESTTSYTIDRTALDNQQIVSVSDLSTLLPGGKTVNATLMNDSRMALRSGSQEGGNASFGTAIEVDGIRIDNNAAAGETAGASTRAISSSNIESVEIVTGIPSVEYGDLSNGVVKVNTRKGKSPFIVEGKMNQHTKQIALNKGFDLGHNKGVLNASIEHAKSFSNIASPHTAYQRNILSLHYMNIFMRESAPFTLNVGVTGNIGGYHAEADPDNELDDYSKVRDNALRANFELNWLLNKRWITNLSLRGAFSTSDRTSESSAHTNSATTLAYIHAMNEGYFIATNYDSNPDAPVILGPTGYWNVKQYSASKPMNWSLRLKGDWTQRFGKVMSRLMLGAEYTGSRNNGRGTYYDDLRYAPTWREFRHDDLPTLNNLALYAEEKVTINTGKLSRMELTAGLRDDITMISGSDYGTVNSLSPRFNGRYIFWQNRRKHTITDLVLHAGWGKSVKLPSFQILYPTPSYYDTEVFRSQSTADNTTLSAWYCRPSKAIYNPDLKWQYTNQTDIGIEMNIKGTRVSLSAFHHRTYNAYMASNVYTPFSYNYTPISSIEKALNGIKDNYLKELDEQGIAHPDKLPDYLNLLPENRIFTIDPKTGVITLHDATGMTTSYLPDHLDYNTRRFYQTNIRYINASPIDRYGLEWIVDFKQIKALNTSLRLDGNYYYYKSADETLFASMNNSNTKMTGTQEPYQYIGWYRGTNSAGAAVTSVANGAISKALNLNTTITTHIPKIRLIVALRLEATLYNYHKAISELDGAVRGIALNSQADYTGDAFDSNTENKYIAVYPEYYSTWDNPDEKIPFAEKFLWAKDNDPTLYNDLCNLVVKSNTPYAMDPNRISAYYSANLSVTKEIGDHVSVSFYANNFFNNMKTVHSSQTDLNTSLFSSSYIPSYYYGLSLRLKL
jgi:outer membrane receptor protein involved in Fe transport